MKKKYLKDLKPYNPNQIDAKIVLSANETENYLFKDGVIFDKDTSRYPEANAESLREKLAEKWSLNKDNFILGNGSTELLELMVKTYVNQGDTILTFTPSFSMYRIYAKIYNASLEEVPIDDDGKMNMTTFTKVAKTIQPKLIFLCTPNNPTGGMVSKTEIITLLKQTESIVVVDEAYMDFAYEKNTMIPEVDQYPRLVVARTFSKAYGLAGYRLGYMVANKEIINDLLSIKLPYNVNQATIEVGKQALEYGEKVNQFIERVIRIRNQFLDRLKELPITVFPSYGNFVYIKSDADLYKSLIKNDILIRQFQDNTFRITIGNESQMNQVIQVLREVFK